VDERHGYGKLRLFTDKRKIIVEFYLYLAASLIVIRRLINPGPQALPLANQAHYTPTPLTIICRPLLTPRPGAHDHCSVAGQVEVLGGVGGDGGA
jgi:hypothetical protein